MTSRPHHPSPFRMLLAVAAAAAAGAGSAHPHAAETQQVGARVPFVTIEAEAAGNRTSGDVVRLAGTPSAADSSPELEASGRAFVELRGEGAYWETRYTRDANALVVRHCIPDAPGGGGSSAVLALLVNGAQRQSLTLDSRHNWLYGHENAKNGQSDDPKAGRPHVFWNESRFLLGDRIRPGDVVRLRLDGGDTAAYCRIDLVDFEMAPPPLPRPAGRASLSVADFGAKGDGAADDGEAFERCIEAARKAGAVVWIPSGTYAYGRSLSLDGVAVQGAGMWHTTLVGTRPLQGFSLSGRGARVADLRMTSAAHTNRNDRGGRQFSSHERQPCSQWSVENVWIEKTHLGFWMRGASDGLVRGCRVYLTYADAINVNHGAQRNVIEENYVRGVGDDGIAILSPTYDNPSGGVTHGNIVRRNTVVAVWWGHNLDLAGGGGHLVEDNYLADNARTGCFTINLPDAYPMHPTVDSIVRRNVVVRGGGNHAGQRRGALWLFAGSTDVLRVVFADNVVRDSLFSAIHIRGPGRQELAFSGNRIEGTGAGSDAVRIDAEARGSARFERNVFSGLAPGRRAIAMAVGSGLDAIENDNRVE